jgi:LysR family glycine cleavage system transcriptional activator
VQITVHAPVSLAALWLAPQLPAFSAANPSIDVRLASVIWDNAVLDEVDGFGNSLRRGSLARLSLRAPAESEHSGRLQSGPVAGRPAGRATSPLCCRRRLIHIMGYENHWLKVRQGLQLGEVAANPGLTVDTTVAALELAAAGAGIALAHRLFLGAYLTTKRLVIALPREFSDDNSYFVITPERPQRVRREVQLFREWLVAIAARAHDSVP